MRALYHVTTREAMVREEETVETVYRISCITDHRAEAPVLMRSLRVTVIPSLIERVRQASLKSVRVNEVAF